MIERLRHGEELSQLDWEKIVSTRTATICYRAFRERFELGASLWLARYDGRLAGYGWTVSCNAMAHRYYAANSDDVHLFELFVFPEFRGQRINSILVNHVLQELKTEGKAHVYLDVAEWNRAALRSYRYTSFHPVGIWQKGVLRERKRLRAVSADELWGVEEQTPEAQPANPAA